MLSDRAQFLISVQRRLSDPLRAGPATVLLVNIDRFEVISDQLGPVAASRALQIIGKRLEACIRADDAVARLRGDEFAVLLGAASGQTDATRLAERVAEALRAPVALGAHQITLTASIGIATAELGADSHTLLRRADIAMCQAKEAGRARYSVFEDGMHERAWQRMCLETELHQALASNAFEVHYQPIVDLATAEVAGYEALVRWRHPERGLVAPSAFIPIAEETGLIVPIGRQVLVSACAQAAAWSSSAVSVNLSARQLERSDELVAWVEAALRDSRLDPARLKLEITESAVMRDPELAIATLWALKGLGVQLAVDDFGTGYSSLAYLKRFPVDVLKIDRSFVEGIAFLPEDQAIVGATVAFARALGLSVVAEGIEDEEQAAMVRELGCNFGQGYLWGKPAPPHALQPNAVTLAAA